MSYTPTAGYINNIIHNFVTKVNDVNINKYKWRIDEDLKMANNIVQGNTRIFKNKNKSMIKFEQIKKNLKS